MKFVVLMENTAPEGSCLASEHGLSLYLEHRGHRLLLDAGISAPLTLELVFAYPADKQPHLKHLLINGQNWEQWLQQNRNW